MKHLLKLADLSGREIIDILNLADQLKYEQKNGMEHRYLRGKTLGMIFQKASTRTRVSFETGMYQLGGHALFLNGSELQMGRGEPVQDTARTLSDAQATAARMLQAAQEPGGPAAEELRILDGRGCTLQQVLYFIGRGCPVIAYGENGEELVLYGYDQYNVSVLSRQTGESYKMGLNDASGYFDACGNDFISAAGFCLVQRPVRLNYQVRNFVAVLHLINTKAYCYINIFMFGCEF